jgi:hypothetical protein
MTTTKLLKLYRITFGGNGVVYRSMLVYATDSADAALIFRDQLKASNDPNDMLPLRVIELVPFERGVVS